MSPKNKKMLSNISTRLTRPVNDTESQHFILTLPSVSIIISDILKVTFGFAVPLERNINK